MRNLSFLIAALIVMTFAGCSKPSETESSAPPTTGNPNTAAPMAGNPAKAGAQATTAPDVGMTPGANVQFGSRVGGSK